MDLKTFDVRAFWDQTSPARTAYTGAPLIAPMVRAVEQKLGYTLSPSYVKFMGVQNGGMPNRLFHSAAKPTTWADDHIAIAGLYSVGSTSECSLCGPFGSEFWVREWGYPAIGIYFADCPSAGHDMLCFDYRGVAAGGEPSIVHVDQEVDYQITHVAPNFESFVRGLGDENLFALD